jgi:hypothetical protein
MRIHLVLLALAAVARAQSSFVPASHIRVQPVIIVPANTFIADPTVDDQLKLYNHLIDAKNAYLAFSTSATPSTSPAFPPSFTTITPPTNTTATTATCRR